MKTITEIQIKQIIEELVKLNIPVQSFIGIQDLLTKLPEIKKDENPTISK